VVQNVQRWADEQMFSGRPSVMSDDLVQIVGHKICERMRVTISELHVAFHKFHALLSARLSQALRNMNLENAHE
jgi:hypothetical protein